MMALFLRLFCIYHRLLVLISRSNLCLLAGSNLAEVSVRSPKTVTDSFLPFWVAHFISRRTAFSHAVGAVDTSMDDKQGP
jgi:hypothetical protein